MKECAYIEGKTVSVESQDLIIPKSAFKPIESIEFQTFDINYKIRGSDVILKMRVQDVSKREATTRFKNLFNDYKLINIKTIERRD